MPPCPQASDVARDSEEPGSDSKGPSEFNILVLPWHYPPSNGVDPFILSPSGTLESPAESQTTPELFSRAIRVPTELVEPPPVEPRKIIIKPFEEPSQPEPPAPTGLLPQESCDDFLAAEAYPHLNQHFDPPLSKLPKKTRNGFWYFRSRFLGGFPSFGL